MLNFSHILGDNIKLFLDEDDLSKNFTHITSLPSTEVNCHLKIKDDLVLAGLPVFFEVFNYLLLEKMDYSKYLEFEGQSFTKGQNFQIDFKLPFNVALSGERLALNLLQRCSSIATNTKQYVELVGDIKILDTRKTTPGLRFLEKYAVNIGGGTNHRFAQTDAWMVKDNHKTFFGGVKKAIEFFQGQKTFYQPIIVEIHDLKELKTAYECGVKHFLLDNFSSEDIGHAVQIKKADMTYEVSGGIDLKNISGYCIKGVDAISSGSLTYSAKPVDLSLKFSNHE